MNTRFAKLICTLAFIFAMGGGAYAQSKNAPCCTPDPCCPPKFEQGMPLCCDTYPRAINAPAAINVTGCMDWEVYGSFIYWHVSQQGMATGVKTLFVETDPDVFQQFPLTVSFPKFTYKPGFKVGAGFSFGEDGWVAFAEYTRLHQKIAHSSTLVSPVAWLPSTWINSNDVAGTYMPANQASKWKMHLDMLDVSFSRPFYQGRMLTLSPYGGMRGLLITQAYVVSYDENTVNETNGTHRSRCWAVGPNGGLTTNWLVGGGFRFEGVGGVSLLYSRYKLGLNTFVPAALSDSGVDIVTSVSNSNINVLRPMLEMGVGFGWGSYLSCQDWYMDLSVRYDFYQFWDQNMIRSYTASTFGVDLAPDALSLHGITATARFDF